MLWRELKTEVEAILCVVGPLIQHGPGIDLACVVLAGQHAFARQHHLGGAGLKVGGGDALHQRLPALGAGAVVTMPALFLQRGQRRFRLQRIEGVVGRVQLLLQIVAGQPEVEAEADALAAAHQLDAG